MAWHKCKNRNSETFYFMNSQHLISFYVEPDRDGIFWICACDKDKDHHRLTYYNHEVEAVEALEQCMESFNTIEFTQKGA